MQGLIFVIRSCGFMALGASNIGKAIDKAEGNERESYEKPEYVAKSNKKPQRESQVISGEKGRYTEWEGWGTALKPAHEPIVLARKPISEKSIRDNDGQAWHRSHKY